MKLKSILTVAMLAIVVTACHASQKPVRPRVVIPKEFLNLSKEEIFKKGEAFYQQKKYLKARSYFSNVYENYPNDPLGRRSLLRIADTFYMQGDQVNLVDAQYKYRDFINRYPGSDFADYALYQIANVAFKQLEKPDRDQTKTREAVQKYHEMIEAYPKSSYRKEADAKLEKAQNRLAQHEHVVARFYMKRGDRDAAVLRLNALVQDYPNYSHRDEVFYDLGSSLDALGRKGEARLYYERVVSEFPGSSLAGKAREKLQTKA